MQQRATTITLHTATAQQIGLSKTNAIGPSGLNRILTSNVKLAKTSTSKLNVACQE